MSNDGDLVTDKPFEEQFRWREVYQALPWHPKVGAVLSGYYRGRTLRTGQRGQYEVMIVDSPEHGLRLVSGTVLLSMLDVAQVPVGTPVKITYHGKVQVKDTDRWYKKFSLCVAEAK